MRAGLLTKNKKQKATKKFISKTTFLSFPGLTDPESFRDRKALDVLFALCIMLYAFCFSLAAYAEDDPMNRLRDETVSYFKPTVGRITKIEDQNISINIGEKDSVKKGMRFTILREGVNFIHPVTKEPLGKLESPVGRIEIKEVSPDSSTGLIITGEAKEGDKVRISEKQVSVLFCQSKGIDWNIADSYFRSLKQTGRVDLLETNVETDDPLVALEEAKRLNAEVALLISSRTAESGIVVTQRLFWVSDGTGFAATETKIETAYLKTMKFGEEFFTVQKGEPFMEMDLPLRIRLLAIGDIDGDKKQEMLLSTGKDVRIYIYGGELLPALGGLTIKSMEPEDFLRIDTIDLNRNGKDEIVITAMSRKPGATDVYKYGDDEVTLATARSGGIVSYIYELQGTEFVLLYKGNVFLRKVGDQLLAQAYSKENGFTGDVFNIIWDGGYKRGNPINLPKGVNLYDFVYVDDPQMGRLIFAYDNDGFLNLYDKDMRLWKSKANTGGFLTTYKKSSPGLSIDTGEWSVKDRLFVNNREVLVVKRIPLLEMVRGIGFKKSQIKNFWWNGLGMEEGVLIDNIKGSILDYAVAADKVFVLVSPTLGLGIKPENILKGENPLGSMLYIYSLMRG